MDESGVRQIAVRSSVSWWLGEGGKKREEKRRMSYLKKKSKK